MKTLFFLVALVLAPLLGRTEAPPGHDFGQRVFPLEAARVLAWQRTAEGAPIAEIVGQFTIMANRDIQWKIQWLDAAKNPLRERAVRYPTTLLEEGAQFYREVFNQLSGEDWPQKSAPPDHFATAFWQGAELAGVSRADAATNAEKLLVKTPTIIRAADASRLSGLLVHAAFIGSGEADPVDALLTARAATWLCTAEGMLREPHDAGWVPILFVAGREKAAVALWRKVSKRAADKRGPAERLWDSLASDPSPQEALLFAAAAENRQFALPVLSLLASRRPALRPIVRQAAAVIFGDKMPSGGRLAGASSLIAGARVPVAAIAAGEVSSPMESAVGSAIVFAQRAMAIDPLSPATDAPAPTSAEVDALLKGVREAAERPNKSASGEASDSAAFASADAHWKHLEELRKESGERKSGPAATGKAMRAWLTGAKSFLAAYPEDPRRWDAKVIAITTQSEIAKMAGQKNLPEPNEADLQSILAAPDASAAAKGEAAFLELMRNASALDPNAPHTFPPFHRSVATYLEDYGLHPRAAEAAALQIQLLQVRHQASAENILKQLATHPNPRVAGPAADALGQNGRMAQLRAQSLDLKLITTAGKEVDFAKLRGKVVLLDFWASWCGPCVAELPAMVKTYAKLRDQGFEIIGVSIDQDRAAMDRALQKYGMTWPQQFDGGGWQNQIAQRFGIHSIPAAWLFDKKGLLRETDLRGEEFAAAVEKLLRE